MAYKVWIVTKGKDKDIYHDWEEAVHHAYWALEHATVYPKNRKKARVSITVEYRG